MHLFLTNDFLIRELIGYLTRKIFSVLLNCLVTTKQFDQICNGLDREEENQLVSFNGEDFEGTSNSNV